MSRRATASAFRGCTRRLRPLHCLGGWETLCESQQNTGYSVSGGFAEYALGSADYVDHLPTNVGLSR